MRELSLRMIKVKWLDVTSIRESSTPLEEELQAVTSVGFLISNDEKAIRLCGSYGVEDSYGVSGKQEVTYRDVTIIPRPLVLSKVVIEGEG